MLTLRNQTKKITISNQAALASTFIDRMYGLLNSRSPRFLIIRTHLGIHTFFMKYPIDVMLLDKNNRVVSFRKGLVPFRLFFYNPTYSTVVEMPKGTLQKYHVCINDKILIDEIRKKK